MPLLHAFDFLTSPPERLPSLVVAAGSDAVLRSWVITRVSAQGDVHVMDGETIRWSDLREELSAGSLFASDQGQTIVVRGGDKLVKDWRGELEQYAAESDHSNRLVLELEQFPGNTRLYKLVNHQHLTIGCSPPQSGSGRYSQPDTARIGRFLIDQVAPRYRTGLTKGAANALVEMLGDNIGLLDSEVAKLAVHLDEGATIDESLVREVVAGWIGKTMWEINDAALGGHAAEALRHLDKLLSGGQAPLALLPQLAWAIRRLAMATAVVDELEAAGRRPTPQDGLRSSGFRGSPSDLKKAESHMKQLGRARARRLLRWLLEADLKLKGSHSIPPRDRWVLEQLVCKLARG